MPKDFPPEYRSDKFQCPHCGVYAHQLWFEAGIWRYQFNQLKINGEDVTVSICAQCSQPTFWMSTNIFYPPARVFPSANEDLSDDIEKIYNEAAAIATQSPRAACALLRLAVDMLLEQLGGTGNINSNIQELVQKGLSVTIQQSLDIVRVTGNKAIHPGKIEPNDITDTRTLFSLINLIADALITQPKQVQAIYDNIPEESRKAIAERDGRTE